MLAAWLVWLRKNPIPSFFTLTFLIACFPWRPLGIPAPEKVLLSCLEKT